MGGPTLLDHSLPPLLRVSASLRCCAQFPQRRASLSLVPRRGQDLLYNFQSNVKMWGPLFKVYSEFQEGNSPTLNQAWGPSGCLALCNCTSSTPKKSPNSGAVVGQSLGWESGEGGFSCRNLVTCLLKTNENLDIMKKQIITPLLPIALGITSRVFSHLCRAST